MIRYRIRRTEKKTKNEIRVEALRFGVLWVTVWRMSYAPEDGDYAQLCAVEVKSELTEER